MSVPETLETDLSHLRDALADTRQIVIDFETSGIRPRENIVAGLGVYIPEQHRAFYINVGHNRRDPGFPRYEEAELADAIRPFLIDPSKQAVAHNATFELRFLFKMGIDVACRVTCTLVLTHRCNENISSFARDPTTHYHLPHVTYGLKQLMVAFWNEQPPTLREVIGGRNVLSAPIKPVAVYCIQDCVNTWRLYQRAREIFASDHLVCKLADQIDDTTNPVLARMMWEGVGIDVKEAERQKQAYVSSVQACREIIWRTLDIRWPLDTPRQALAVLRHLNLEETEDLEFNPFPELIEDNELLNEKGIYVGNQPVPSVTRDILTELFDQCTSQRNQTVIAALLSMWSMKQRVSSFLNPLPQHVRYTGGRLYPDRFSSTLVTTRFSSSPNVQNLPGRADKLDEDDPVCNAIPPECREHHKTRNVFIARPGHYLVSIDLSAAEPRYLALLCQRALEHRERPFRGAKAMLQIERRRKYPKLLQAMYAAREDDDDYQEYVMPWPSYHDDPLWLVFRAGGDPYEALLKAINPEEYAAAVDRGDEQHWLRDNRHVGKKAFLALGYGSTAESLAPKLGWSVERTKAAIENLESEYATIPALRELTEQELIHIGEVRTLWGRPRRINGYYQLARPNPLTVQFSRQRSLTGHKVPRTYLAEIIPLGTYRQGVQAFVKECCVLDRDGKRGEIVLAGNMDGTVAQLEKFDPFVDAIIHKHFNNVPFANIPFSQIKWVREENGLKRFLPRQARALRQAFNAMCQGTGADHLRWLMNNMGAEVCRRDGFRDCKLVLTVHDSLVYEVPKTKWRPFVAAAWPVMTRRPNWATIDIKVDVEVGVRFGKMRKVRRNLLL